VCYTPPRPDSGLEPPVDPSVRLARRRSHASRSDRGGATVGGCRRDGSRR
jgi:hypothetical protein